MAGLSVLGYVTLPISPAAAASPPGVPELIAPAAGHVFGLAEPQVFTLRVTDLDGDGWVGLVEVGSMEPDGVTSTFATPPAASGEFSGSVAIPQLPPGRYEWRARAADTGGQVGGWSEVRSFAVGSNTAPGRPVLLAPEDAATLRRVGNLPFEISALDAEGDPFRGSITIQDSLGAVVASIPTSPAPSGGVSSGLLAQPLSEGAYTWSARAVDAFGATSQPSSPRSFSVGPAPTVGGGVVTGSLTYASPGLPPAVAVCEPSSASVHLESAAMVVNTALVGYVGPITLDGSLTSGCESALSGNGSVTLAGSGSSPTESFIQCNELAGTFTRLSTTLVVTMTGGCSVNGLPISRVALRGSLEVVPTEPDAGLASRVLTATAEGVVVVRPD